MTENDLTEWADHTRELEAGIRLEPHDRHVLIVEPDGLTYVGPHLDLPKFDSARCEAIRHAAHAFVYGRGIGAAAAPAPGRYWCDVSEDGVFEIGGRVADS